MFKRLLCAIWVLISISLVGCGASKTTTPTYKLSGTVSGLNSGDQVILLNNGSNATTVSQSGSFSFSSTIAKNGNYAVTVGTQPANQTCTVTNDTGTGVVADVTNVTVSCVSNAQFAYVANTMPDSVSTFSINSLTGSITAVGSPTVTAKRPLATSVDPARKFLYVAQQATNASDSSISVFSIDSTTGVLTEISGSPFAMLGRTPYSIAVDPTGKFLYVADPMAAQVTVFKVNSTNGALSSELANSTGLFNTKIAINPTGNFAYVTDFFTNKVSVFSINTTSGALTAISGSPFTAGTGTSSVVLDSAGKYAYVSNSTDSTISVFSVNSTTGSLTSVGSALATGMNPYSVAMSPNGKFVFTVDFGGNSVSVFSVNSTTGALTAVTGSPFTVGTVPKSISIDASSKFVYVANYSDSTISAFAISSTTGVLTAIPGSPFASGGTWPEGLSIK